MSDSRTCDPLSPEGQQQARKCGTDTSVALESGSRNPAETAESAAKSATEWQRARDVGVPDARILPSLIDALPACVSTDSYRANLHRPAVVRPFGDGDAWTVATSGMVLLAVRGAHLPEAEATVAEFPNVGAIFPNLPAARGPVVELRAVREFLGLPPVEAPVCESCGGKGVEDCLDCEGSGEKDCACWECGHEHQISCKVCGGLGEVTCPECKAGKGGHATKSDPFWWGIGLFNRNILRPAIRALPDVSVEVIQADPERAMTLLGEGWFLMVMPMRPLEAGADAPRFEMGAPAGVAA